MPEAPEGGYLNTAPSSLFTASAFFKPVWRFKSIAKLKRDAKEEGNRLLRGSLKIPLLKGFLMDKSEPGQGKASLEPRSIL